MAKYVKEVWSGSLEGYTRADRKGGTYEAYHPDLLRGRDFSFTGDVAAEIADATQSITQMDKEARALRNTEVLARLLLRAEAVASSRIEGLQMGARKLLHAEIQQDDKDRQGIDVTAADILANIDAMTHVVSSTKIGQKIAKDTILQVHQRLMPSSSSGEHEGGVTRCVQNWIGGNSFNPFRAEFVPPPPAQVDALLQDLVWFCNQDSLPAIAQAAIAHAQFEVIHPFTDGNGRTGRALIQIILRRRGLVRRVTPPISLILATRSRAYISGLRATQYEGDSASEAAQEGMNLWVSTFSGACRQAIENSVSFEQNMQMIQESWREKIGKIRSHSATDALLSAAIATPVMTVQSAAAYIQRSFTQTNDAIARLVEAGVLKPVSVGKRRSRVFEANDVIDAFRDFERQMASPVNDTRVAPPAAGLAIKVMAGA